jgi:hypothetical protein
MAMSSDLRIVSMAVKTPAPERAGARKKLAKAGKALSDGSFPIPNVAYLKKALKAVGRAAPGKRPALAALIRKRARALGATNVVKGTWADNTQSATAMSNALRAQLLELGYSPAEATVEVQLTQDAFDRARAVELAGGSGTACPLASNPIHARVMAAMKKRGVNPTAAHKMADNAVRMSQKKKKAAPAGK